ncbi:hypothetical protein [Agrobacterium sp. NPDC089420]|uniref:hypothetical protein n=1 Tax=Agrobacterium sp. NPDC089420 TaxID=3363918 RepID=UPI00384DA31E
MRKETRQANGSPKAPIAQQVERLLLAVVLSFISAMVLIVVIPVIIPDFFGSCFEGACGYAAVFAFAPVAILFLSPIWWLVLRRLTTFIRLILWFFVVLICGHFIFPWALWISGLAFLAWLMIRLWRDHRRQGRPFGELFGKSPDEV